MRLLAMTAFALTLGTAGLVQAAQQDFTLVNRTGYTVSEVYVSGANARSWQEDVLGDDTLDNGQHVNIHFERGARGCIYDLKVVYSDGDTAQWGRIDLCKVRRISIYYDRKAGTTRAVTE